MTIAFPAASFELKGEETDPAADVTKALGDLKAGVDAKLASIEQKSAERLDKLEARLNRPAGVETKAASVEIERKAFTGYLRRGRESLSADEVKSLTVADTASAGYLAPPQFGSELLKLLVQYSPLRSYATVKQIGGPSITYPRRKKSLSASWVGETTLRTESQPSFEQVTLTPGELAAYVDVSNQLLEDNSYDLESELYAEFAEQFGVMEGAAFINGNGVNKPKGIMEGSPIGTGIYFSKSGPVSIADTLIEMFHSIPSVHAYNGSWIMNRNTMSLIRTIKDSTGRYLLLDSLSEGAPATLLGRPIVEMVDMPEFSSTTPGPDGFANKPILFGDLKGYRIVDRVGLSILRDPFGLATVGQTRFHARKRVGGDITNYDRFAFLTIQV